jgi:hypothetical protein
VPYPSGYVPKVVGTGRVLLIASQRVAFQDKPTKHSRPLMAEKISSYGPAVDSIVVDSALIEHVTLWFR